MPYPAPFHLADWERPGDRSEQFLDDAHMRAVRRWLDACATWRYTGGRSVTPNADVPGTSLHLEASRRAHPGSRDLAGFGQRAYVELSGG